MSINAMFTFNPCYDKCNYMDNTQDIADCMKSSESTKDDKENSSTSEKEIKTEYTEIAHHELIKLTKEAINNIIESDPLFRELPPDVTLDEIKAQAAVVQGQAITLYINRGELPKLAIVVPPHDTTVLDLKKAIKRHTSLCLKRENVQRKISWKHVWRKYHLSFQDIKLSDDNENIKAYGISNKAELHYVKKRREKNKFSHDR